MEKTKGCGQDGHLSHQGLKLSTSGVNIMASMEGRDPSCSSQGKDALADHEKPGFKLCSHVDSFS